MPGVCCLLKHPAETDRDIAPCAGNKSPGANKCVQSGSFCAGRRGEKGMHLFYPLPSSGQIPINAHDVRLGLAFFTTVQPSLRTLNNSQILS